MPDVTVHEPDARLPVPGKQSEELANRRTPLLPTNRPAPRPGVPLAQYLVRVTVPALAVPSGLEPLGGLRYSFATWATSGWRRGDSNP